jgi:hypothetical protein
VTDDQEGQATEAKWTVAKAHAPGEGADSIKHKTSAVLAVLRNEWDLSPTMPRPLAVKTIRTKVGAREETVSDILAQLEAEGRAERPMQGSRKLGWVLKPRSGEIAGATDEALPGAPERSGAPPRGAPTPFRGESLGAAIISAEALPLSSTQSDSPSSISRASAGPPASPPVRSSGSSFGRATELPPPSRAGGRDGRSATGHPSRPSQSTQPGHATTRTDAQQDMDRAGGSAAKSGADASAGGGRVAASREPVASSPQANPGPTR